MVNLENIRTIQYYFMIVAKAQPKQSFRIGKNNFKPKDVENFQANVKMQVLNQLGPNYLKIGGPVLAHIRYNYPFLKKHIAIVNKLLKNKTISHDQLPYIKIAKTTRPDVTDNLNKGIFDAINGLVLEDDAIVYRFSSEKYFTNTQTAYTQIFIRGIDSDLVTLSNEIVLQDKIPEPDWIDKGIGYLNGYFDYMY